MSARDILSEGRVAQKRRTRQALLDAGLRILERGEEPSLDRVAAEADVSRATAYRYFPRIESLLAVLPLAHLVADPEAILGSADPGDPVGATVRVQRYFYELAVDNEVAFRRFLRAILDEQLRDGASADYEPVRGSYRLRTLERALGSLEGQVDPQTRENLRVALVALSGVESLLAVKDVVGLDPEEGWKALDWAARVLVEAAIEGR